jgi:hypothetical protein
MYWLFYKKVNAGSSLELLIALLLFGIVLLFSIPFFSFPNSTGMASSDPVFRPEIFLNSDFELVCPVDKSSGP